MIPSLLEIIDWTRLNSIDPIENDKETIKLIDFNRVSQSFSTESNRAQSIMSRRVVNKITHF